MKQQMEFVTFINIENIFSIKSNSQVVTIILMAIKSVLVNSISTNLF
jgi:hypothetical protein